MKIKSFELLLSPNPVLVKEVRGRMRGARAYLLLTGMLTVLGVVTYGLYRIARASMQYSSGQQSAVIGQSVFIGLVFFTLGLVCFITPALTAGAVSGEHERKTYDMLMATPLRPASVLIGKLTASLSYALLLVIAAVPMVSLSYVFGGVAVVDMIQSLLLLLGCTLTFGVIGMFFSILVHRTALATVLSYLVLALFVVGTLFAYALVAVVRQQTPPAWLLALNPFSAMASALVNAASPNNFYSMGGSFVFSFLWGMSGVTDFSAGQAASYMPLWRYTVGLYAWLTLVLLIASAVLVRPVYRYRLSKRAWAGIAAFVLISVLAVPVLYGPLTPKRVVAWLRWNMSRPTDLIANGTFTSALEPAWATSTETEHDYESGGQAVIINDDGQNVVAFSRAGSGSAATSLTQVISQSIPADSWLQIRLKLRIKSQDLQMCGVMGSECPLMLKLVYSDAAGGRHEWLQGFYAVGNLSVSSTPSFCTTCEVNQLHIQTPLDEWYTYESSNLLEDLPARGYMQPAVIHSLSLVASGHSYETQVAELALNARAGRPPGGSFSLLGVAPTPPYPPPMMMNTKLLDSRGVPVPVMPLATPVPAIDAPEEWPEGTPTPLPPLDEAQ